MANINLNDILNDLVEGRKEEADNKIHEWFLNIGRSIVKENATKEVEEEVVTEDSVNETKSGIEIIQNSDGSVVMINHDENREVFFQPGDDANSFMNEYVSAEEAELPDAAKHVWDMYSEISTEISENVVAENGLDDEVLTVDSVVSDEEPSPAVEFGVSDADAVSLTLNDDNSGLLEISKGGETKAIDVSVEYDLDVVEIDGTEEVQVELVSVVDSEGNDILDDLKGRADFENITTSIKASVVDSETSDDEEVVEHRVGEDGVAQRVRVVLEPDEVVERSQAVPVERRVAHGLDDRRHDEDDEQCHRRRDEEEDLEPFAGRGGERAAPARSPARGGCRLPGRPGGGTRVR